MTGETSPVKAPESSAWHDCAPWVSRRRSESISVWTDRSAVDGGITAMSTAS